MLDAHVFTHFSNAGAKLGKANGGHVRKRSWIQSNSYHHPIYARSHLSCASSVEKSSVEVSNCSVDKVNIAVHVGLLYSVTFFKNYVK